MNKDWSMIAICAIGIMFFTYVVLTACADEQHRREQEQSVNNVLETHEIRNRMNIML